MLKAERQDPLELLSKLARSERSALAAAARAEGVSAEDAVECVQEALCKLLVMTRQRGTPPPNEWPALLTGIVKNAARNRRRRHFRARPHDEIDESALADPRADTADELILRAEAHVRLRACVEDLCEIQKAVVTLRLLEERAGEDVARALGISNNHVAVLLHRAKLALRACMTQ
jgi:RNA polymerase sigma-70 factor (ECF subfamily)